MAAGNTNIMPVSRTLPLSVIPPVISRFRRRRGERA